MTLGLSKFSGYFTLHLINVEKLKRLRQEKFQVTWKPPLKPTLLTGGFLSFEKGEAC